MNEILARLECLKMALSASEHPADHVKLASQYSAFVLLNKTDKVAVPANPKKPRASRN